MAKGAVEVSTIALYIPRHDVFIFDVRHLMPNVAAAILTGLFEVHYAASHKAGLLG